MGLGAHQHSIVIEGEPCLVWVAQDGRQWLAWGNYRGVHVKAFDRSEEAALTRWRSRANHLAHG
jgi:hypothetical protein